MDGGTVRASSARHRVSDWYVRGMNHPLTDLGSAYFALPRRRCEMDGQTCHYSVKAKSGPKPHQARSSPVSPMTVGVVVGEVRSTQAVTPEGDTNYQMLLRVVVF